MFGTSFPALSDVVSAMIDHSQLLLDGLRTTIDEAVRGHVIGVAVGVALAGVAVTVQWLRAPVNRLSATINAVPVIVLGPLLIARADGEVAEAVGAGVGLPAAGVMQIAPGEGSPGLMAPGGGAAVAVKSVVPG